MRKILFLVVFLIMLISCGEQAPTITIPETTEPEEHEMINLEINETETPAENETTLQEKTAIVELGYQYVNPQELKIEKGTKVTWKNVDDIKPVHNIIGVGKSFQSGKILYGGNFSYVFDEEGTYEYIDFGYKGEYRDKYKGTIVVS